MIILVDKIALYIYELAAFVEVAIGAAVCRY
jgi:hypothetical protein